MRWSARVWLAVLIAGAGSGACFLSCSPQPEPKAAKFVGSSSCRACHERFYKLWAPSHHGLAMQPYTAKFARSELTPQKRAIKIGGHLYRADISGEKGWVIDRGPEGAQKYLIQEVMGGKNVYYFLTPWKRGRLQVLPVAYDVNTKQWYDTAASGVRHFPDIEDSALDWRERPYTFNTSCYSCHVSQLTSNYDLATDTYHTRWAEPGINCETCHGPASEHVRYCKEDEKACASDLRLIRTKGFSPEQVDGLCAPCHAKMMPLGATFRPGERYFDHYDLVTLEHRDFYPDGRDLGENYTFTTWRMSPCANSGKLDCVVCHTSSGRFRFKGEKANQACLPCHADKVGDPTAHTHHAAGSEGNKCIACHMPMTTFAQMRRSDHSMRPPTPASTIEFGSPNACNICHTDHDARWADRWVRKWRSRDYQAPVLERARLLDEARKGDWSHLDKILAYVESPDRDEIYANSFVRLLQGCDDQRKWDVLVQALHDSSPLIRSSAATALAGYPAPHAVTALAKATRDEYRLVRIRAAAALARVEPGLIPEPERKSVRRATEEFLASLRARPDDANAHAALGNYYMHRGQLDKAIASFETSLRLNLQNVAALVNASLAYNMAHQNDKAEACLRDALKVDPANAAANFNLGLLLGEMGRKSAAKEALRRALKSDSKMAAAAYNLCVLEAEEDSGKAVAACRQAVEAKPEEARYAYTLGFFQARAGDTDGAIRTLRGVIGQHPNYLDAYMLLGKLYRDKGDRRSAVALYEKAREIQNRRPAR